MFIYHFRVQLSLDIALCIFLLRLNVSLFVCWMFLAVAKNFVFILYGRNVPTESIKAETMSVVQVHRNLA